MFTGIIKEVGKVAENFETGKIYKLAVATRDIYKDVKMGDSVSVNGVCLTVTGKRKNILSFDVMGQTASRTSLSSLNSGDAVNLEDSLKAGNPVGGHFVLGHVDCVGKVTDIEKVSGGDFMMEVEVPGKFKDMIVEKGSVALDGVSLTVGEIRNNRFKIYLIPHTLASTTLGSKKIKDGVNIEFDILGKYALRHKALAAEGRITEEFLEEKGFGLI